MKKLLILFLVTTVLYTTGCMSLFKNPNSNSSDKIDNKVAEIQVKKEELATNNGKKLSQIGILAVGTHHALDKEKDPSKEVEVAKELNDRVMSLAGSPDIKDVKRIQKIVDDLISAVKVEREKGRSELNKLDKEIQYIQSEREKIKTELAKKSKEFEDLSSKIANENDENKGKVEEIDKWFGLGAIFYGVKKFVTSLLVGILIFCIIFFVLKLAASTNPIAAAIFKIFEFIGSAVLCLVKSVTPKSFNMSNFVDKQHHDKYKSVLDKIVDTIQDMRNKNETLTDDKKYKLDDLFENLSKVMDKEDKDAVEECLKELKWRI
jgi:hemerythrin-like domain-containing protein